VKVWGIDTYGSVFKKLKETGIFDKNEIYPYITEGIGEDIVPANVDMDLIDHFEKVTDRDAAIYTPEDQARRASSWATARARHGRPAAIEGNAEERRRGGGDLPRPRHALLGQDVQR
jgi:hypothetical protein